MSCTLTSLDPASQAGVNSVGSAWEDRFDSTAMPIDSIGPSQAEFKEWLGRERGLAARALQLSKNRGLNFSDRQIALHQLRYNNLARCHY